MMFLQNYETLRLLSSSLSTSFTFQKRAKKRLKTNHADLTFSDVPRPFHYNALSLDKELQRFVRVCFGFSCLLSPLMSILEISFRHWTQFFPCYFLAALKHLCPEMHAMAKNRQPLAIWIGCQKWPLGGWRFWRNWRFCWKSPEGWRYPECGNVSPIIVRLGGPRNLQNLHLCQWNKCSQL